MSTGLLYYGARYYDPALGRFISADTVVPGAGNPQNLNRYAYVRNNPLRYTDPTGHWTFEENPDDSVLRWTRLTGSVARSVSESSASTDRREELRNWMARGVRFTGATWTANQREIALTALDRVETALGSKTTAALGLGGGQTLTFNRVTTGISMGGGPDNTIDFRCDDDSFEYEVETAIHEMGHVVDWHARPENS
jgi:RHS repeat-associated protein